MKVTLPKDYKQRFTIEGLEIARMMIRDMKDDVSKPEEYAELAVKYILNNCLIVSGGVCDRVIEATVEIAKNGYRWEPYGEGCRDMDMWLTGLAKTSRGYLEFGMYMSDIWTIGGEYVIPSERVYATLYTK